MPLSLLSLSLSVSLFLYFLRIWSINSGDVAEIRGHFFGSNCHAQHFGGVAVGAYRSGARARAKVKAPKHCLTPP